MYTFYNPRQSALAISILYHRKCGMIEIAKSLNPNVNLKGGIQKGQRLFDWNNKLLFTISPEEAAALASHIRKNINPEKTISFFHAPTGNTREKMTSLTVSGAYPLINITIVKLENDQKDKITFTLKQGKKSEFDEIQIFVEFLDKVKESPFIEDFIKYINFLKKTQQNNI